MEDIIKLRVICLLIVVDFWVAMYRCTQCALKTLL